MSTSEKQSDLQKTVESAVLAASVEHVIEQLNQLSVTVHNDTIALAEMRAQLLILMKSFEDLAILVRNGSDTSVLAQMSYLNTKVKELCGHVEHTATYDTRLAIIENQIKNLQTKRKNLLVVLWGVITVVIASIIPFILQFIEEISKHIAP
jgi:hypothetical protein